MNNSFPLKKNDRGGGGGDIYFKWFNVDYIDKMKSISKSSLLPHSSATMPCTFLPTMIWALNYKIKRPTTSGQLRPNHFYNKNSGTTLTQFRKKGARFSVHYSYRPGNMLCISRSPDQLFSPGPVLIVDAFHWESELANSRILLILNQREFGPFKIKVLAKRT